MTTRLAITMALRRYSRNPASIIGAATVLAVVVAAVLAPYISPFPEHAGTFVDFANMGQPPNSVHLLGTDLIGRDIFSRILFGFRSSLLLAVIVLSIAVSFGTFVGLLAGYGSPATRTVLMYVIDIFLSLPSLLLAMAIIGLFRPSQIVAMMAVSVVWWPWYARLVGNLVWSIRREGFVLSAELVGASKARIALLEILPNCVPSLLTKASIDMGLVVLLGASLSFVGLGAPPPQPDLGTMVAEGASYLPEYWWLSISAGFAIFILVIGFNLVGDGLQDLFDAEQ